MTDEPTCDWPAPAALNALGLPPVDLPFPIISPFTVRADLHKLREGPAGLIRLDEQYPMYARARLDGLMRGVGRLLLVRGPEPGVTSVQDETAGRARLYALIAAIEQLALGCPTAIQWATDAGCSSVSRKRRLRFLAAGVGVTIDLESLNCRLQALREDARALPVQIAQLAATHGAAADRAFAVLGLALALNVQEDFVLMRAAESVAQMAASDRRSSACAGLWAEASMVSFPSGWSPELKMGRSLADIHAPVADGQALRRASPSLSLAMLEKGPFVRYVWTLSEGPALDRRPGQVGATVSLAPASLARLWFRCERQTTLALPGHSRALFLIRVYVAPLLEAADTQARRELLAEALRSMTPAMVEYKNIAAAREIVLRSWGRT